MPRCTHVFPHQALIGFRHRDVACDLLLQMRIFALRTFRAFSVTNYIVTESACLTPAVLPNMSSQLVNAMHQRTHA